MADKNNPFGVNPLSRPIRPNSMPWRPADGSALASLQQALATQQEPVIPQAPEYTNVDVGPTPERSNYHYFNDITNAILEKPLSEEEEQKRVRAAHRVASIGALGNALSAFSNLTFTGGIAPSQKLPETYIPSQDVKAFRDRVDRVRDRYLQGQMAANKLDEGAYNTAYDRWLKGIASNNANAARTYDAQLGAYDRAAKQYESNRNFDYKVEKDKSDDEFRNKQAEEQARHNKAQEGQGWARINNEKARNERLDKIAQTRIETTRAANLLKAGGGPLSVPSYVPSSNGSWVRGYVNIDGSKMTPENLEYLRQNMPDDVQEQFDRDIMMASGDPKKVNEALRRMLGAVANDENISPTIYQLMKDAGMFANSTAGSGSTLVMPGVGNGAIMPGVNND